MKRILVLLVLLALFISKTFSQTAHVPGPAERKMVDSLCSCVTKLDLSKITNKQEAEAAYTACVEKHIDILTELADERHVEIADEKAMEKVGVDLAISLMKQNCKAFTQIATLMGGKDDGEKSATESGNIARIENRGFNYLIISGPDHKEKSFIWLSQFPGSEKFMNGITPYVGKKVKIRYREIEVYLPLAKGYYKVKEIVSVDFE